MARHDEAARKLETETPREEPRAPQAYSTGEYDFFRTGDSVRPSVTGVTLPIASAGWVLPVLAVGVLALLTFLLLH